MATLQALREEKAILKQPVDMQWFANALANGVTRNNAEFRNAVVVVRLRGGLCDAKQVEGGTRRPGRRVIRLLYPMADVIDYLQLPFPARHARVDELTAIGHVLRARIRYAREP